MHRALLHVSALALALLFLPAVAASRPATVRPGIVLEDPPEIEPAKPGAALPGTTAGDTVWISDWTFDAPGGGCTDAGWTRYDNRILNDGSNWWAIDDRFDGVGFIALNATVLARHDLCWARDGYGNAWDYAIVLRYRGAGATLSFDFLSDSEPDFDFVTVEADSAGVSESRVDYAVDPAALPEDFRRILFTTEGPNNSRVTNLPLPDFGLPAVTHEAYIRFESDYGYSDEDGLYASSWNAGLVVDNVAITGTLAYTEDFEGALDPNVSLMNTAPATPFGEWARVYLHVTDNDACTENTTCAWLWSDLSRQALQPDMAFGPGQAIVRNWLDDVVLSPWVSVAGSPPGATGTVLSFRRFPGNRFSTGKIVQNWSVRAKLRVDNTDTPAPGDSIDCVSPWGHASWNSLTNFTWVTVIGDMTPYVDPGATEIQVRFRVSDWQYIAGDVPPATLDPGPGPYLDRVRIGRRVPPGPAIEVIPSNQAQDGFPSARNAIAPGENFSPTTERFGTIDLARAFLSMVGSVPWTYNTADSIHVRVSEVRGAAVTGVGLYAAIVAGPHAGKAPPPWTVGANGFFYAPADTCWSSGGDWFVDLDDEYFRGGDVLVYFWAATDAAGGFSTSPAGLSGVPSSVEEAQLATGGLYEVDFLPAIDWDLGYLARVAAHPSGKVVPTPEEIAHSHQRSCILYYMQRSAARRSGPTHRTAFMYTLDRLGYEGLYDVYFQTFYFASYNVHLAGRMTPEQGTGYGLIVQDAERLSYLTLPQGGQREGVIDQTTFYRDWLAQAPQSEVGRATLWLLGDNLAYEAQQTNNPLVLQDMGVAVVSQSQSLMPFPNVDGQTAFTWAHGDSTDFTNDLFALDSRSCTNRGYDGLRATGTAVVTHRYTLGGTTGDGAAVMNANPAAGWNSILMSFSWSDIRLPAGAPPGTPDVDLLQEILVGVLPESCRAQAQPTDADVQPVLVPWTTRLHGAEPNPFNPMTRIRFDLAREGPVALRIYDVAGRLVRVLVDEWRAPGRYDVPWQGQDDAGRRAASGVYFCRLVAPDLATTRKVLLIE